jgi:hypothetical protein
MTVKNQREKQLMNINELKTAGKTFFSELGEWSYDKWEELNDLYFDGKLEVGAIIWGLTPHGRTLGFYSPIDNQITLHSSLVEPKSESPWDMGSLLGEKFAEDVLLHEMIHQYLRQYKKYTGKESHNCDEWCEEIVRIAKMMGEEIKAKPIKPQRVDGEVKRFVEDGHLSRMDIKNFPHSIRPNGYYEKETSVLQKRV